MPTYRLLIEYDGSDFHGWQIQPDQPTVQKAMEDALATVLRTHVDIVGSGRTDAGVHARGQVAHFAFEAELDTPTLVRSLNGVLPNSAVVLGLEQAPDGFHGRYDAIRRTYFYQVTTAPRALDRGVRWQLRPPPDFSLMNDAAKSLIGTHNFDSFCITQSETRNRVCTVEHAEWVHESRQHDWRFEIIADRFLHGMVRTIVGTLVEVGRGKRPADDARRVISAVDRRAAGTAAPAHGLVLERVDYPEPVFVGAKKSFPTTAPNSR